MEFRKGFPFFPYILLAGIELFAVGSKFRCKSFPFGRSLLCPPDQLL